MKTAASVFSLIGASLQIIASLIVLLAGQSVTYYYDGTIKTTPYPGWVWLLWVLDIIVKVIILFWRYNSVEDGYKIGCGICTLLFVSFLGGILTLCIPEYELTGYYSRYSSNYSRQNNANTTAYAVPESNKNNQSASEILSQKRYLNPDVKKVSITEQEHNLRLIKAYKELLEDGVITQEEFDQKKEELLNK